jgi:acyl-CoA thioesterase-1
MLVKLVKAGVVRLVLTVACLFILGTAAQAQIRIVALGDSNIRGKGVPENDAYPAKLERALRAKGHSVVVTNAGTNGDTTTGVLNRLDTAVPPGTQIVILSAGANDALFGVNQASTAANIDAILSRLRARNIGVLYFGALNRQSNPARRAEIEAMGVVVTPALQHGIADDPKLHVEEVKKPGHYHLNAAGYDIVVARTLPLVEDLIAKVK